MNSPKLIERAQTIRLLLSDVDGVLTDGKLIYSGSEVETKEFHVRDGLAVKLWRSCGFQFGFVTARTSDMVARRADELQIDYLVQGRAKKLEAIEEIAAENNIGLKDVAYIGDDLHDLQAIQQVGFGATVADAATEVAEAADFQTKSAGGMGALRELIEFLLKAKEKWEEAIQPFRVTSV